MSSTLDDFYSWKPPKGKCLDCGSTENLTILFTTEDGDNAMICPKCLKSRDDEGKQTIAREKRAVDEMAARDEWEEK